jgi:hypothetical protein
MVENNSDRMIVDVDNFRGNNMNMGSGNNQGSNDEHNNMDNYKIEIPRINFPSSNNMPIIENNVRDDNMGGHNGSNDVKPNNPYNNIVLSNNSGVHNDYANQFDQDVTIEFNIFRSQYARFVKISTTSISSVSMLSV